MLDISTVGKSVDATKVGVGNISPRALRRRTGWYWHPLGCRAVELKNRTRGVIYTVLYGINIAVRTYYHLV